METIRIGLVNDLAVIVERKRGKFYPVKTVIGHYVFEKNIFIDSEGKVYNHLLKYESGQKNKYYFLGNVELINRINKRTQEKYLNNFKKFIFTTRAGEIICEDIVTHNKYQFQDSITNIHNAVIEVLKETIEQVVPEEEGLVEEPSQEEFNQPISEIKENLRKYIKGQDELVDKLASSIFEKYTLDSKMDSNILLFVPSEDEKNQILTAIKKSVNIPVNELSLPDIDNAEEETYDEDNLLVKILNHSKDDVNTVQKSIIVIDGIEEVSLTGKSTEFKPRIRKFQKGLSKLLKSENITITQSGETVNYDASKNLFICIFNLANYEKNLNANPIIGFGANDNKDAETNHYGLIPELLEATHTMIKTNNKSADEIYEIILNDDSSLVSRTKKMLEIEYGVEIKNLDNVVRNVSKMIAEKKATTKEIMSKFKTILDTIKSKIYENPNMYNEVILGDNVLNDNNDFKLVLTDRYINDTIPERVNKRIKAERQWKN